MERTEYAIVRDFIQKHFIKILIGIAVAAGIFFLIFGRHDQAYIDCQWRGLDDMFNGTWKGNNACLEACRGRFRCLWPFGW